MPSGGADTPYGSAGRVYPGPRDEGDVPATSGDATLAGPAGLPAAPAGDGTGHAAGDAADGQPAGRHDAGRHGRPSRAPRFTRAAWRELLRAEGRAMVLLLGGGLLVAALWRLLAPEVADAGNPLESAAAVDGTLTFLGVLAGVVTAAAVLLWPGSLPTRRTLVVLAFALIASVLSWQVGDLLGQPELRANGVALVWPIITAGGLFAGSLLPVLSRRLEP